MLFKKFQMVILSFGFYFSIFAHDYPFNDPSLPADVRAADLVSRLSLDEKIAQLGTTAPPIPRLKIPSYTYWNEACHGVYTDNSTIFPQIIGLSSTWDTSLAFEIADAISSEARVLKRYNAVNLTFFTPTINMGRDPRWGRNEETYGEDVFLAQKMVVKFIAGLQGNDPKYLKIVATVKHFACNNLENIRTSSSSNVNERSLREYYFPVFKAAISEAHVTSVMSAYNALNGIPCTANQWLLTDVLRKEWGFNGYVVSDCDAVEYLKTDHHYASTNVQAAVLACKSGCDLNCGTTFQHYLDVALAAKTWSFQESTIDTALKRVLTSRFLLGEFDPPDMVPYNAIPSSILNCQDHHSLSLKAARESIVLLKNDSLLPLDTSTFSTLAIIGPFANVCRLGGYSATPTDSVTPLKGITDYLRKLTGKKIIYEQGCLSTLGDCNSSELSKAVYAALHSDIAIVFVGSDFGSARESHDLVFSGLPGAQQNLVESVYAANPRTIVVLVNGNPLPIPWIAQHVPAIVEAWFGGPYQGTAISDVLFGSYNPGGKLTQTWVNSEKDLPPMDDYNIFNNRTYMYFKGDPLFPFGHGLSYTTFSFSNLTVSPLTIGESDTVNVTLKVTNTGNRLGDEVVQCYIHNRNASVKVAKKQLKGFSRVSIPPKESRDVNFKIPYEEFSFWDTVTHAFIVEPGAFDIMVGASSENILLTGQVAAIATLPNRKPLSILSKNISTSTDHVLNRITFNSSLPHDIEVMRLDGQVIFCKRAVTTAEYHLPNLPPGVYMARITQGKIQKSFKLAITY